MLSCALALAQDGDPLMKSCNQALLICALCVAPFVVVAGEERNPVDRASMMVTGVTGLTTFGTLGTTSNPGEIFHSAKGDALAFVGSGARFAAPSWSRRCVATEHCILPVMPTTCAWPGPWRRTTAERRGKFALDQFFFHWLAARRRLRCFGRQVGK